LRGAWGAALALGLVLTLSSAAAARDVELRGTLLCRDGHDPLRERPADLPCILVRSDQYPRTVELVESSGLFRLRLPSSAADRPLVIRVFRGENEIHAFRQHIEPARFVRTGDVDVFSVGSHLLPQSCEELSCTLDMGLAGREQLLAAAPASSGNRRKLATFLAPVLLLVPGAFAAGGGGQSNTSLVPDLRDYDLLDPGTWPEFARATASPAIGRTLTSPRHPEATALWNPSALALDSRSGLSMGAGSMNSVRASGWVTSPESWREESTLAPRVLSVGFTRYSSNGVIGIGTDAQPFDMEEELFLAGIGFGFGTRVGASASLRHHVIRDEGASDDGLATLQKITDFDVATTVEATPWLRVAAAGYALRGVETDEEFAGEPINPRTFVVGAGFSHTFLNVGVETSVDDEGAHVAAGASFHPFGPILVDVGGGSRDHSIQMGLESVLGPARLGFRVRQDELDAFQHDVYLTLTH
jgi:hypothetical protein